MKKDNRRIKYPYNDNTGITMRLEKLRIEDLLLCSHKSTVEKYPEIKMV